MTFDEARSIAENRKNDQSLLADAFLTRSYISICLVIKIFQITILFFKNIFINIFSIYVHIHILTKGLLEESISNCIQALKYIDQELSNKVSVFMLSPTA